MKMIWVLLSICGSTAFAKKAPHAANCTKIPSSAAACLEICKACESANFLVGDMQVGTGFYADCAEPIIHNGGSHQPKNAKQALPPAPASQSWAQIGQQCQSQGGMPKGL